MLWKLASHNDVFVRRAIYRLLVTCLDKQPQMLSSSLLSAHLVAKGLHTSQAGSSLDFVKALVRLSEALPTVWTSDYQGVGKKSSCNRLRHFLRKGSQGGPITFWTYITLLLKLIPDEVIFGHSEDTTMEPKGSNSDPDIMPIVEALRAGVTSKEEPQSNATSAWNSYLDICQFFSSKNDQSRSNFVQKYLFPLVHQFVRPSTESSQWTIAGPQPHTTCAKACDISFSVGPEISHEEWQNLSSKLIEDFQISSPEQSKGYVKSQDSIGDAASRWYSLQATVLKGSPSEPFLRTVRQQLSQEIATAISVLATRNGKPYGVATALHMLVNTVPQVILKEVSAEDDLLNFAEKNIPQLMTSPSAIPLIQLLDDMEDFLELHFAYLNCIESIESSLENSAGQTAMMTLLSSPGIAKAGLLSITTNKTLARAIDEALKEKIDLNWKFLMASLENPSAPKELTDEILSTLTKGLSIENSTQASLGGLLSTAQHNRTMLRDFAAHEKGSDLIAKLLFVSEELDAATSQQAKDIIKEIESAPKTTGTTVQNTRPLLNAIQQNFRIAGEESLT